MLQLVAAVLALSIPVTGGGLSVPDWRTVEALEAGAAIRISLKASGAFTTAGFSAPDGSHRIADSRTLVGRFVSADAASLAVDVRQGAAPGTWVLPKSAIASVEAGSLEKDSRKEGALIGLAITGAAAAAGWLMGGGDDPQAVAVLTALFVGGPVIPLTTWLDHRKLSFEPTALVYEAPEQATSGFDLVPENEYFDHYFGLGMVPGESR